MTELKWLDGYSGESIDDLVALASTHRVDSIVLAIEQALQQRAAKVGLTELSEAELTVLAVEALEREVNNGGYHQFFFNTSEFAPFVVDALRRIACPETAEISAKALSLLGLRPPLTAAKVAKAIDDDPDEELVDTLSDECDGPYYEAGEPIAERLLDYVRAHRASIRLP
jgi:hypothetical protein